MIYGIGTDIAKNSRFESWSANEKIVNRFFNEKELAEGRKTADGKFSVEFLASRFAAKEAFVKALGCGFRNISLNDIYVISDNLGKPELQFGESGKNALSKIENPKIHISLSHEKEFSVAFVVIESL